MRDQPGRLASIILGVVVALVAAGCGSAATTDDAASEPVSASEAVSTSEPVTPTAVATVVPAEPVPAEPTATVEPLPAASELAAVTSLTDVSGINYPEMVQGAEGIATDPATGRIFVGDFAEGIVWVGSLGVAFEPFALPTSDRNAAVGLAVDAARDRLYVATFLAGLLDVHDLSDGSLIESVTLPEASSPTINDVTVASNGEVFVTDSGTGRILRYLPETGVVETWVDLRELDVVSTRLRGLQTNGIVVDDDVVLVNHMATGSLLRIDRETAEVSIVDLGDGPTAGRDGMALCGDRLYGVDVEVMGGEEAVVITELNEQRTSGEVVETIRRDDFVSISTLAPLDDHLLVVNAQFSRSTPKRPYTISVIDGPCESPE